MKGEKIIIGVAAAAVVVSALAGAALIFLGKREEPTPPPTQYQLEDTLIPALPVTQEKSSFFETLGVAENDSEAEQLNGPEGERPPAHVFIYEDLTDVNSLVAEYKDLLTSEAEGYLVVDETMTQIPEEKMPALDTPEGSLLFAKEGTTEGQLVQVNVSWTPESCTVTLSTAEGTIQKQKKEKTLTMMEALDCINRLLPSQLGLEGSSMDEYQIYTLDGSALIDGHPCIRMNVYCNQNEVGTNVFVGCYFLSTNGEHLYQLDRDTGVATELDVNILDMDRNFI